MIQTTFTNQEAIALEAQYGAKNYKPLPVVLSKGEGVFVWDEVLLLTVLMYWIQPYFVRVVSTGK
jgi:hypothetical protein